MPGAERRQPRDEMSAKQLGFLTRCLVARLRTRTTRGSLHGNATANTSVVPAYLWDSVSRIAYFSRYAEIDSLLFLRMCTGC